MASTRMLYFSITEVRGTIKKTLETENKITRVAIDESFADVSFNLKIDINYKKLRNQIWITILLDLIFDIDQKSRIKNPKNQLQIARKTWNLVLLIQKCILCLIQKETTLFSINGRHIAYLSGGSRKSLEVSCFILLT